MKRRVVVGGLCPRGGGHTYFLDGDDTGGCGHRAWDLYVEVTDEEYPYLPEWVQRRVPELSGGHYKYVIERSGQNPMEISRDEYVALTGEDGNEPEAFGGDAYWAYREWVIDD